MNPRYWPAWRGEEEAGADAGDVEKAKLARLLSALLAGKANVEGDEEDAAAAAAPCPVDRPIAAGADDAICGPPRGGGVGGDIADPAPAD